MDDFRKIMYGVLIAFIAVIVTWVSIVYISACGLTFTCRRGVAAPYTTPIPTLQVATLPVPDLLVARAATPTVGAAASPQPGGEQIPRPSNAGDVGEAVNLKGDANAGAQVFQANCTPCHGVEGKQGVPNPGTETGSVPTLNPIDPALTSPDHQTFATNLDLFIQHGSTPAGPNPSISMPAWGDSNALTQQQIADVIAYLISLNPVKPSTQGATQVTPEAASPTPEAVSPTPETGSATAGGEGVARPSNPGGPGEALNLTGDAAAGAQVFQANCVPCHGPEGAQGVANPGTDDGSVPTLNPIDPTMVSSDYKTFAYNIDLFVQHGSTPAGPNPSISMPAWGDQNALTQQQIADVIAYVISLNKK